MGNSTIKEVILGVQMLFVAFGALVLIPLLTGLDPSTALFTAGSGTIFFQLITKRSVPIFLASSIAFIAPAIEHVGDLVAISEAAGKDYIEKPDLQRTLLGDGIATIFPSFLGGLPNTTYSEVTDAVAFLKRFEVKLMTIAAIFAITLAFLGKLGAALKTISIPVMGGIVVKLFGMIAAIGIASLVFGIGDMSLGFGNFQLAGIGLAGIVGVLLNILLPKQ